MPGSSTGGRARVLTAVVAAMLSALVARAEPWTASARAAAGSATVTGQSAPLAGSWGELTVTPIVISPPLEYLQRDLVAPRPPQWAFPNTTAGNVAAFLTSAGLDAAAVESVIDTARPLVNAEGIMLTPDAELVRGLRPQARARIYLELGKTSLNIAQDRAFRYFARDADEWLGRAPISPRTRQLVEPLLYPHGDFLFFADFDLVRREIADPDEVQSLHKRLLRQQTLVVSLRVTDPSDLDRIVEYWGRGGRRTDIRPLLESLAEDGGGASIDITHLLPTFVRQYLYRYPRITPQDLSRPLLANCLWTALNFFNATPDDRYLDETVAIATLKRDYYYVYDNQQLGDVVVLADSEGNLFHAAVYLAGGLIFGKNGASALAPWSILPLAHLEGHYAEERARGWRVSFLRRKDL
jgi:hypothetical protein